MTLQVMIATMHQTDFGLLDRMNIQSDAIVVNQCEKNEITEFTYHGHHILWLSLCERGVGLSRNTALMRATADIVLFADDDVIYEDGYPALVIHEFEEHPHTGLVTFNLPSLNPQRPEKCNKRVYSLHWYNCLKHGAIRIAVRRQQLFLRNVFFSLLFGGGTAYGAGEDSLFILECLRKGISGRASVDTIGAVKQESSTWFRGITDKYLIDKGVWLAAAFPLFKYPFALYYGWRLRDQRRDMELGKIVWYIFQGFKAFEELNRGGSSKQSPCGQSVSQ